jgi:hypothetical protein
VVGEIAETYHWSYECVNSLSIEQVFFYADRARKSWAREHIISQQEILTAVSGVFGDGHAASRWCDQIATSVGLPPPSWGENQPDVVLDDLPEDMKAEVIRKTKEAEKALAKRRKDARGR